MEASLEDMDFMQAMEDMLGLDEDAVEKLLDRLDADDLASLADALVNQDKARAEQVVSEADTDETVNPLFRGDLADEGAETERRVRKVDDDYRYKLGDNVQVEVTDPETGKVSHKDGTVYLPNGPNEEVGVKIQGKAKMVMRNKLNKIEETVLGMVNMPNLERMQQLAGMQPAAPPEIEVPTAQTDPCSAAQQAMDALDVVQTMLPNIRLADLKAIRQRILNLQTSMNEGISPGRARKL